MVDKLKNEIARLSQEVCELRDRADVESAKRHLLEEENPQLYHNQQRVEDQVNDYANAVVYFKSITSRCFLKLDEVLPVLEDLRNCTSVDRAEHCPL
jgi:hypothetical protein